MGKILNKLKQLFIGKPIVFYVSLLIDLVMFALYSHITYKANMAIYKYSESAWPYFVDFVFAALLIDRVYRIYVNFKKHYDVVNNDDDVLKQKRKELLKMRKSLEAATALVQKLRRDKIKYQEKIEARLQENPDAEDAKIDVFLSEIDRLDSRIAIGESTRENFESKVNILIRECNALEIMPEPEVENHIEEPNNDEVEEELNYYNQQLTTLRAQRVDLLRILERVRGNIPANDPTLERAESLLQQLDLQIRNVERRIFQDIQNRVDETIIHSTNAYSDYVNRNLMR
jgi:chromosome segregation ATPase